MTKCICPFCARDPMLNQLRCSQGQLLMIADSEDDGSEVLNGPGDLQLGYAGFA